MFYFVSFSFTAKAHLVCIINVLFSTRFAASQGGNALELQRMNENLMSKKCPMEVCQSVCMVKNATTGCFTCNPYCGAGSGASMMSPSIQGGMLGNFNPGGYLTEYSGCNSPCRYKYNSLGRMTCSCPGQKTTVSPVQLQGQVQGLIVVKSTKTPITSRTTRTTIFPAATNKVSFRKTAKASTNPTPRETTTTDKTTFTSATKIHATNSHPQTGIGQTSRKITQIKPEYLSKPTTTKYIPNTSTESRLQFERYQSESSNGETAENKTNIIIIFVLSTLLFVTITICIVFLVAWKRTARELHRNQNELYFVNKAIRQDSCSSRTAILPESVYAHIGGIPEIPSRASPLTSCSSSTPSEQFLLRTVSLSSETPLKETVGESAEKHDYLQLI